ncbi:hypothetical protein LTR94_026954, partial [Friedmanniomyces endolithicus]
FLASEESRRAVATDLIAQVALGYLLEREYEERAALTQQSITTRQETLRIMRRRYEVGSGSKLDLAQSQVLLAQADTTMHVLNLDRAVNRNALALLVGQPMEIAPGSLRLAGPGGDYQVPAGLPSELLTNRPDIVAAEHQLRAANANIGAARAAFFPNISLTGAYGTTSPDLDGLFGGNSEVWSFSPTIRLPLFNAGRLKGNLDVAQAVARLRQAREALVQSRADLFPSLSGTAGYSRSETLRGGGQTITLPDGTVQNVGGGGANNFSLGASAQYQLGLFGDVRGTIEASRAQYQASGFDYATTLLTVEQEVARNYVLARLYQAQLGNARASLALQDDNLEIAGFRVQAGLVSSLDREQARAQRAQTAASIPSLEQQYSAAVARLGVLTAQAPGALRPLLAVARPIPNGPAVVGTGIPADVLRQRPD